MHGRFGPRRGNARSKRIRRPMRRPSRRKRLGIKHNQCRVERRRPLTLPRRKPPQILARVSAIIVIFELVEEWRDLNPPGDNQCSVTHHPSLMKGRRLRWRVIIPGCGTPTVRGIKLESIHLHRTLSRRAPAIRLLWRVLVQGQHRVAGLRHRNIAVLFTLAQSLREPKTP